ncbi:5-formyltetrahydrofolate cyclo-ligase [Amycolatopsis azurea]|uniref:5-formyltetrahydrofolate cyclo-ligase n=1 Tax=Amycolatopsis azurea DSM 43854 TaxID=1238180 RepID=A0ABX3J872_9PSEU|nr:5-formyltetrahydrofolate cyclo-ligase [Amycolatopsis azurea]OOC03894.1 5-formyltetrahydrofolate cyclo-ligase [Amycolatopsis azurea DSM 43854]
MSKAEWRTRITAERRSQVTEERAREAAALASAAARLPGEVVCAYMPFGTEPGSRALLDQLLDQGKRVLLPIVPAEPGPLGWAVYEGPSSLGPGRLRGLLEPTGRGFGPDTLGTADLVLIPALAVDDEGVRLGRGAGYYDRSLSFAAPGAALIAVVRDAELVRALPAEPHDVRMTGVLTPDQGVAPRPVID